MQFQPALFQGLGPFLGAPVEQGGAVQMGSTGAFFIGNTLGSGLDRMKGALITHPAVGGAENIRCQHRQPRAGLGHRGCRVPLRAFQIMLGGLCLGCRNFFLEQAFEVPHAALDHPSPGQQGIMAAGVCEQTLTLLVDGNPGQVPGLLLLQLQVLALFLAFEQQQQGVAELDDILDQAHGVCLDGLEAVMADVGGRCCGEGCSAGTAAAGVVAQQRVCLQGRGEQGLLQGPGIDVEVMPEVVQAAFNLVPACQQLRVKGLAQGAGGLGGQLVQGSGLPGIAAGDVRAWPQQALDPQVPQLGVSQTVAAGLAKSGIAAIEQDVQVQHVQRLTKMQWRAESDLVRIVGVVQGIAGVGWVCVQTMQAPVLAMRALALRVEDIPQPGFGFGVALLHVQAAGHQPGQVQEQLPEVLAVGTMKIQWLGRGPVAHAGFVPVAGRCCEQMVEADVGGCTQLPANPGVHADRCSRLAGLGIVTKVDERTAEIDVLGCSLGLHPAAAYAGSKRDDRCGVGRVQGQLQGFEGVAADHAVVVAGIGVVDQHPVDDRDCPLVGAALFVKRAQRTGVELNMGVERLRGVQAGERAVEFPAGGIGLADQMAVATMDIGRVRGALVTGDHDHPLVMAGIQPGLGIVEQPVVLRVGSVVLQ